MEESKIMLENWKKLVQVAVALQGYGTGCVICLVSTEGEERQKLATAEKCIRYHFNVSERFPPTSEVEKWEQVTRDMISVTALQEDAVSSWQLRDSGSGIKGCAIVFLFYGDWIGISADGLGEHVNEAVAVIAGILTWRLIDTGKILEIIRRSGNDQFVPLLNAAISVINDPVLAKLHTGLQYF